MDNNVKTHIYKNKKTYISVAIAICVIIFVFAGYEKGYRFKENFMIGKIGFLSMVIPLPQTNIYIDDEKITTKKDNEVVTVPLSPRNHTVIVSRDGYFPWRKNFLIPSDGIINLSPIFVPNSPSGMIITKNDPDFWKIRNEIITDTLPTINLPRISKDGKVKLWIDENAMLVETASSTDAGNKPVTKTVIQPEPAIRNLYFYKDRSDVAIFSVNSGIYAIEVDKEDTQNFLPIYKGAEPSFIEGNNDYIYVLDGETLMQVAI